MNLNKLLFLLASSLFCFHAHSSQCIYGLNSTCDEGKQCLNFDTGQTKCLPVFNRPLKTVLFPFNKEVVCDQGNLSPNGNSHTWVNSAFALDLTTKLTSTEPGIIRSGASGKVISYSECTTKNDNCGAGFGNHVKVLTDDGFILFYAHLDTVSVKTNDFVQKGSTLGVEGETGLTGKDNPHLHFSVHHSWKTSNFEYWKGLGYLPPSVPFSFKICDGSCESNCPLAVIRSTEINCLRTNPQSTRLCRK